MLITKNNNNKFVKYINMFLKDKDNNIKIVNSAPAQLIEKLDAGVYTLRVTRSFSGTLLELLPVDRYNIPFNVTAGVYEDVVNYVNDFVDPVMEETRKELGKVNKLGLMFKGDPGTGKTFLACQIGYHLSKIKNAITILVSGTENSFDFARLIDQIREYDKDRFVVLVFDEFEKDNCYSNMLSFLDGADSKENTLLIATVNDTSMLHNWIMERRGRFERVFDFAITDKNVFSCIVDCMLPEVYKGKVSISNMYDICEVSGMNIDNIGIEIRNAIFRYKKTIIDPTYAEKNVYKLVKPNLDILNKAKKLISDMAKQDCLDIECEEENVDDYPTEEVEI
jgi:ATP-dependent 26S proteasome regulatory subunit